MKHPAKWRETADPFGLNYHDFELLEILGYPHAGNDVFHVKGLYQGKEVTSFIKIARSRYSGIDNEIRIMKQIDCPYAPQLIDYGLEKPEFIVTLEKEGERLSTIVSDNSEMESLSYMREYGEMLAQIHSWNINTDRWPDRKFHHQPVDELLEKLQLSHLKTFFADEPREGKECFCHGDFHYANILWEDHHINAILDFELAGMGNRDFDIAWALFRRPGQRFMKTDDEIEEFLAGYGSRAEYDRQSIRYYMAQCYVYFLEFSKDEEYSSYIRRWLELNT